MSQVDWVLSHVNDKHFDMGAYGPFERVMHQLHMMEVWAQAGEAYKNISTPPCVEFCTCINDVDGNGIVKLLRFIALQIREPELMLGQHTDINGGRATWGPGTSL